MVSKLPLCFALACMIASSCTAFSTMPNGPAFAAGARHRVASLSVSRSRPSGLANVNMMAKRVAAGSAAKAAKAATVSAGVLLSANQVLPAMALACLAPTLLGLWKTEYTVSYGYGLSMAFTGLLTIAITPGNFLAQAQAACYVLYGLRLVAYLMYREVAIPQKFSRESKGNPLARLPTIIGCALLYLFMSAPLRLTATAGALTGAALNAQYAGLFLMYAGWALAAVGDAQKTYYKAKLGDVLVTKGVYSLFRHPNYTGEEILWTGSLIVGLVAAAAGGGALPAAARAAWAAASVLGAAGIWLVLVQATSSLEKRQARRYAGAITNYDKAYAPWRSRTWAGFTL